MFSSNAKTNHVWRFFRAGGFDQVRIENAADISSLDQLDQKLWVALACPTRGLEFDVKTLDVLDTDKDGRIRAPEIIAAAKWACGCLKDPDDLMKGLPTLPLSSINDDTPEGKKLLGSAKQILTSLGKKDATVIAVEDTADTAKIFAQTLFNGDGIIPAEAASDDVTKSVLKDIMTCLGPETDRSGKPGVSIAKAEQFFKEAQAYLDWWKKAESDTNILPVGEATPTAAAALKAVKGKVDDYFLRCRLAEFDARAVNALNREEKEYLALAAKDLSISASEVASFPVARVAPGKPLPLTEGVNPAWTAPLAQFQAQVVRPLLGDKATLNEAEWAMITAKFGPYETWAAGKAGAVVEKLGLKRVRDIMEQKSKDAAMALLAQDKALEPEFNAITNVDRLIRCHRDLARLLTNYVSFRDFYSRKEKAVFQAGTLYLDQRSCDLCIRVEDMGKHGSLASLSRMYLAYCECTRKATNEKMTIAAAFTNGDADNLMVGRNGIFYDRQGRDWDATIVKIVDNPISIRQAFWTPYKKIAKLIQDQIEKVAAAKEKAVQDTAAAQVADTAKAVETKKPPEKKEAFDVAKFAGIFAAIGLAIGAIGGAIGAMLGAFMKLASWQIPLAVIGIMLIISGPSVIIAWLKLRQRNLGPLLDANGWAVNAKARINIPFGASLTRIAALPPGAHRDLRDPFAESNASRNTFIAGLVLLILLWGLWYFGAMEKALPGVLPKSEWMKQRAQKPAATSPAVPSPVAPQTPPGK
ncbi:MAG: hypothetical protein FJ272_08290 [Planctomycetes bacterium]|nr:hypothetical protein [Planctomycetota bacterium]